jgi:NAD+ synthase
VSRSARGGDPPKPPPGEPAGAPWEIPAELRIDTDAARRIIAGFVRGQLRQAGFERALLGLSGGIDSALVAYLVAEAIGPQRLLCLLMPYRTSSPASRIDAEEVVARLGCASRLVDISPIVDGYFGTAGSGGAGDPGVSGAGGPGAPGAGGPEAREASPVRRGNFMARARMAVLYDASVSWGGLVVGTGNKTESLIGYTTLFGDSACAFNPIGDLYKTQVRQLALAMGVPEAILRKQPSADLWPGQTDEAEAGFIYHELDRLLYWMIDRRRTDEELLALGFDAATISRVARLVATSEFKRQVPPIAKLGPRTSGVDYLYPRRRPGSGRT